ncbi:MAG: PIN domain-containing protein [Methanobrevibacter sp.]|jgi:predicted nucleic acid-binding protein|nr:PIN domain-containing protein [Candidatus Methanoflexus mossambicus]
MIFFDTNFIVALYVNKLNNGEKHKDHDRAIQIWDDLKNEKEKFISNLIIIEVMNVLNIKLKQNNDLLKKVYYAMYDDFKILDDTFLYNSGFKKLLKFKKRLSINDCIYMSLMEELGINKIVSFDTHFDYSEEIIRIH